MDTISIILILLVVVSIAISIVVFIRAKKKVVDKGEEWQSEKEQLLKTCEQELLDKGEEWQSEKEQLLKTYEQELLEKEEKAEEIKCKYESLLAESKTQIAKLDEQLQHCIDGHVDDLVKERLENVDKLKKRIDELQSELEDYEDDIDGYKKKLKKKSEETNDLQDQLHKVTKAGKQLQEDLEKVSSELEDKKKELKMRMESLLFVQEILSATSVSDANTKELYNKVDNVCNYIGGDLRDCIHGFFPEEQTDELFKDRVGKWAATAKKRWIKGKTTIAFVGEFSAGKTSIVNRILSQDNPDVPLLPVSTKATTAIPTYISGGPATQYNFVTPDNIQKNILESTFKRVNKEVLDSVKGVSSLIQYFVMTYKNDNLNSLSILDTPGFSSNDKEDAERTIEVINECDALFWVFDVNAGTINRSSITLIKENLKKPLFVVINKVDTKAETEVDKVEQLIRKTLQDEDIAVQDFIRFSAKANLNDIMDPIKSVTSTDLGISYLETLTGYVDGLVDVLLDATKKTKAEHRKCENRCKKLQKQYNESIDLLKECCNQAKEVPNWKEYLIRKNRYEMNEDEYNNLVELLEIISDARTEELQELYDNQMEAQRNAKAANDKFIESKDRWRKMNDCREQLGKYIKLLN